jgi:DNA-binding transcriptional ArsR family regulator
LSSAAGGKDTLKALRLPPPNPAGRPFTEATDKAGAVAARSWTFITNHAQVLLYLGCNSDARVSELAAATQITERAAYRILDDLEEAGYITRERQGRRNHYRLNAELPLEDPVVEDRRVADLLALLPEADTWAHALAPPGPLHARGRSSTRARRQIPPAISA